MAKQLEHVYRKLDWWDRLVAVALAGELGLLAGARVHTTPRIGDSSAMRASD